MRKTILLVSLLLCCCGGKGAKDASAPLSKEPISVRGWVADVEQPPSQMYRTRETEAARRLQLFQGSSVAVDNAPYVSGGLAENGSFVLLDVPPGKVSVVFTPPGGPDVRLILENVPGNADVFIPAVFIKKDGVTLLQPNDVKVRMAAKITKAVPSGTTVMVAGHPVPVINTPVEQMTDRRDFPSPGAHDVRETPLARVR